MTVAAQCAHLRVSYRTETHGGMTRGWWECDDGCGRRFTPTPAGSLSVPSAPMFRVPGETHAEASDKRVLEERARNRREL